MLISSCPEASDDGKILVIEDNKDLAHVLEIHIRDLSKDADVVFD